MHDFEAIPIRRKSLDGRIYVDLKICRVGRFVRQVPRKSEFRHQMSCSRNLGKEKIPALWDSLRIALAPLSYSPKRKSFQYSSLVDCQTTGAGINCWICGCIHSESTLGGISSITRRLLRVVRELMGANSYRGPRSGSGCISTILR